MFLLREFNGNKEGKLVLSYKTMSAAIDPDPERQYYRPVRRAIYRLRDKYKLIDFEYRKNKDPLIYLKGFNGPEHPYRIPQDDAVEIPKAYWDWGWSQRLTFPGKVMYMLGLRYSEISPIAPVWFRSQEDLAKKHGFEAHFVQEGVLDLRRHNLIEVNPDELVPGNYKSRNANQYVLNPLYDPRGLERAFQELEQQYGAEKVRKAREYVSVVYEDSDVDAVRRLIVLEEEFGADAIRQAVEYVGEMSGNNPKKTIGYLIATMQGIGGREGRGQENGS